MGGVIVAFEEMAMPLKSVLMLIIKYGKSSALYDMIGPYCKTDIKKNRQVNAIYRMPFFSGGIASLLGFR